MDDNPTSPKGSGGPPRVDWHAIQEEIAGGQTDVVTIGLRAGLTVEQANVQAFRDYVNWCIYAMHKLREFDEPTNRPQYMHAMIEAAVTVPNEKLAAVHPEPGEPAPPTDGPTEPDKTDAWKAGYAAAIANTDGLRALTRYQCQVCHEEREKAEAALAESRAEVERLREARDHALHLHDEAAALRDRVRVLTEALRAYMDLRRTDSMARVRDVQVMAERALATTQEPPIKEPTP